MKRIIPLILALLVILSCVMTAGAKTVIKDGDWLYEAVDGDHAWEVDSYLGSDAEPEFPVLFGSYPVLIIGDHAFVNNETVVKVTPGAETTTIGEYTFSGCTALTTAALSSSITTIGVAAFANDTVLTDVSLAETSLTVISAYCFAGCTALTEISLPESCTAIGNCAFQNCSELASVLIPASVTEISSNAFSGCEKLVINAPKESYAIEYAIAHEIPYQFTDYEEVTFVIGDADGDGVLSIMDATRVQRVLALLDADPDGMIALRCDVDHNELEIMDATRIQRKLALYSDNYHIGETVTVRILANGTVVWPS